MQVIVRVGASQVTAGTDEVELSVRRNHSDKPHPGTEGAKRTPHEFVEDAIIEIGIEL